MIRSAAIQAGNIIQKKISLFDKTNLFILKNIPESSLNNKNFPLIRIDDFVDQATFYSGNKKRFEVISCQVNLFVKTNRELEIYSTQIEKHLCNEEFSCFFRNSVFDTEFEVQHVIMRFRKCNDLKGVF